MRDSQVVASIVAGDPAGLAEAYDKYAAQLYTYGCTLLREPPNAATAVQDTFVLASSRLAGVRNPERLRAWLFAVARNECLRRVRDEPAASAFDDAASLAVETVQAVGHAERAQARALLRAAIRGLNPGDRDVIVLQLSQGLDAAEVAAVFGVTRTHAHWWLSRARDQLVACVEALLVGRTGRDDCADLSAILGRWEGHLTAPLRRRVTRHIGHCTTCSERQHEVRPAMLMSLAASTALLGAAASVRHVTDAVAVTSSAKTHVLAMATSGAPGAVAYRTAVANDAASFASSGFPEPLNPPRRGPLNTRRGQFMTAAVAGAAVAAATITLAVLSSGPGPSQLVNQARGGLGPSGVAGVLAPSASASAAGGSPGSPSGSPSRQPGNHRSSSGSGSGTPGSANPDAGGSANGPASPSAPLPSGSRPATSSHSASGARAPEPSSSSPSATPVAATSQPPAAGTLTVSPSTVVLAPLLGASFTITANGGPVTWSISIPPSLIGAISVSQASGTLQAGQSAAIAISTTLTSIESQLTVNPGNEQVAIIIGLI